MSFLPLAIVAGMVDSSFFGMVRVAEKAFHMALLVIHAFLVPGKTIFRAMAFDTVGDFFRRRPFRGLPSSRKVFIEIMNYGIDDLPGHLCAALIFLLGSDLGAGGQRPLGNRCMAERRHRLHLDLLGACGDIIEAFRREFHSRVPPHHPVYDGRKSVIIVVGNEVDEARADAQGAAKRAVSCVSLPGMREHIVRQCRPGITDFLF